MKIALACLLGLFLLLPARFGFGKPWKDITPGVSTRKEVLAKFGSPTQEITRGTATKGILYQGEQEIEGARQTQIFFDAKDVVEVIHVFPKAELKREQIISTFGDRFEEKLNESFKTYFFYKSEGMVVYFKEGNEAVASITYQAPAVKVPAPATPATPSAK